MLDPRLWRDDHSTAQCTACAAAFSLFRCRRHHCRHCGGVFCDACTGKRLWLRPWTPDGAARPTPTAVDTAPPATAAPSHVTLPPSRALAPSSVSESSEPASAPRSASEGSNGDGASLRPGAAAAPANAAATPPGDTTPRELAAGQRRRCHSAAVAAASSGSNGTTTTHTTPSPNPSNGASAAACARRVSQHHRCSTSGGLTASSAETEAPAPLPLASFPATTQVAPLTCAIEGASNATAPAGAAVRQAPSVTMCGKPHAGVDGLSGLGVTAHHSRRGSSSIFSGSLYAVSPSSATGDRLSQAWASPDVLLGPEQGGSSSRLLPAGSGVAVGAAAAGLSSMCVSSTSDMNLLPRGASAHVDPLDAQTRAPSPRKDAAASRALAATGSLALMARRAAAARLQASDPRGDASPSSAAEAEELYRRESYGVDVDAARCITWYLCRVCRSCYDRVLDVILDAHETPTAASGAAAAVAAAALQGSAGLPLWYYVRLCASATGSPHPTTQRPSAENSVLSASASPTSASMQLWSSAWARLRTSISLSHAASSPASRAPSITASPVSTNMAAVALPSLQPRDLCCTQDGSGHLSPSTLGPKRAGDSVLSFSAISPISSPRHQLTPRTAAAQPQQQPPQPQQVTSPPAPFPVRAQRPVTPPRRRLISIDGSGPGPTRQAVALARRRRRIAVVLIDERDVAPAALGESAARAPVSLRFPSAPPVRAAAEVSPRDKQLPVPRPPASRRADRCSPASTPGGGEAEVDVFKPLVAKEEGGRVAPQAALPSATHSAAHRPKLSILVDSDESVVEEADTATGGSGAGGGGSGGVRPVSTSASVFGGDGAGALHGLSPAVWLAPHLPAEASAWLVHEDAGAAARAALLRGSPLASAYKRASPEVSPSSSLVSNTPTTSHPISCAPGGPAGARGAPAATAASGAAGAGGTSGGHAEGKRPAVPLAAESATCVLQALFAQIGAAVHLSATPATTASTSPTPASAAAAAAAAVMSGGAFGGASSAPRWGTGPQSYAAQRQALVRDMLARYQQQSAVAAGLTSPFALSSPASGFYANSGGSDASRDGSGSGSGASGGVGGCVFAAAAATPRASGATALSGAGAACTAAGAAAFERVTASVTTYFQIRPPPSVVRMPAEPTVLTILPVVSQVELVGIPIDTSATCAATATVASHNAFASPRGRPSGSAPSATANGLASVSGITGATARPFTLAEFLSQLAKLSTNLDGYVIVVLRRHARSRGDADAVTSLSAESGGGTPQLTSGTTGGAGSGSTFTSFALTDEANPSRESSPSSAQPRQSRRRGRRGRHYHRVSVLFDGSHLRQLHQQLLNCGVAQPALSVVEVYDEEVRLPAALEQSPGSVASNRSPIDAVSLGEVKGSEGGPRSAQLKPRVPGADGERRTSAGFTEAALGQSRVSPQLVALSQSTRSVCSSSDSTTPRVRRSAEQTPLPPSTATGSGKLGDLLEGLQLPSAVVASHGAASAGRSVAPGSAAATAAPAAPVSARAARAAPSAQDSATASLHAACRQLDVAMTTLTYATPTTVASAVPFPSAPALCVTGGSATPARSASTDASTAAAAALKSPSAGASAGGGSAYLARALESLVTTLVYRDLHGTLAP